jgi:hypothetical protein
VSLLQSVRYADSFLDCAEAGAQDFTAVIADGHFLLNAAAQAEKALRRAGYSTDTLNPTTIRSLRNVHEHWEQHKASFASRHTPKKKSGKDFRDAHPDHLPWTFKIDGTGTWISALRIEDLWTELGELEQHLLSRLPNIAQRPERGTFPRRDSRIVAFSFVTQNVVLDFDE